MTTILVVDDHTMFRQAIVDRLTGTDGLEVVYATASGAEAVRFVGRSAPDVAIVDIALRDMSGIDVAKEILGVRKGCKIIFLSMYKMPEILESTLGTDLHGYVLKNDAYEDLIYAIRTVINGGTFVSPSLERATDFPVALPGRTTRLTDREFEVLRLIADGLTSREIAERLCVSLRTVEVHRARLMEKLRSRNTAQLVSCALRLGLLPL